jgi:hypothetical protein
MFNKTQGKLKIRLFSLTLPIRLLCGMFSRVEVGWNASTVALVEGEEKRTRCLEI